MHTTLTRATRTSAALTIIAASFIASPVAHAGDRYDTPNIVALGDSYGSGEGTYQYYPATTGLAAYECHRSPLSWQARAKTYAGKLSSTTPGFLTNRFATCSGSKTYDVNNQIAELHRRGTLNASTDVIYLSVGGNDTLFSKIASKCALLLPCFEKPMKDFGLDSIGLPQTTYNKYANMSLHDGLMPFIHDVVAKRLMSTIVRINEDAPNAKVVWAGYPNLLGKKSASGTVPVVCNDFGNGTVPSALSLSNTNIRNFFDDAVRTLNSEIQRTAAARRAQGSDVQYADTYAGWDNHDLCAGTKSWINGINFNSPGKLAPESLHPTTYGFVHYTDVVSPIATDLSRSWVNPVNNARYTTKGAISAKYLHTGANDGILGYPASPMKSISGGYMQYFGDGRIYYSGAAGAHYLRGGTILKAHDWAQGRGDLGFPVSDSNCTSAGVCPTVIFQNGGLKTTDANHYVTATGPIGRLWAAHRAELGDLVGNQSGNSDGAMTQVFTLKRINCWQGTCYIADKNVLD